MISPDYWVATEHDEISLTRQTEIEIIGHSDLLILVRIHPTAINEK